MPYKRVTISINDDLLLEVLHHQAKLIKKEKKTFGFSAAVCDLIKEGLK